MKLFFSFLFLLIAFTAFSQDPDISWSLTSRRLPGAEYRLEVKAVVHDSWYIYAAPDSANDLSALQISWDNQNVHECKSLQPGSKPALIKDVVFQKNLSVFRKEASWTQTISITGSVPAELKIRIQGFAANGKEFQPINETKIVFLEGGIDVNTRLYGQIHLSNLNLEHPVAECGDEIKRQSGILSLLFLGMVGGLIALLTPCVFPMIPVTVSFFTGKAKSKRAGIRHGILYGSFIFLIYILASVPFHLLGNINPEIFNSISTNAWVNLAFFGIFIFFALSFFGLFEITVPSSLVTKSDSKSGLGSIGGIFFMAFTLATVSFSCTGPILGSLLVGSLSSSGGAWQLTSGMSGFGLSLALPFALFAMFPEWLKRLPKSGGWLDTVKKILAFVELALAFKFLSNADLVQHWGILKREIFIGIWVLISAGLTVYLCISAIKNYGSSRFQKVLIPVCFAFTLYLVPGLTNTRYANRRLLSGFAPPLFYSIYNNTGNSKNINSAEHRVQADVVNDFEKALALSKAENKPILIDFTGWACVNCRKMEEQVWTNREVMDLIKSKFILLSLYVDDRKKLADSEKFEFKTTDGAEKEMNTQGDKWASFESENFKQVTQPLYVILSPDQKLLNHPVGYTPDVKTYKQWLDCGLRAK